MSSEPNGNDYPEQLHAGKVGYGPNYHAGPTTSDKIQGLKEEIKGKITRHPELTKKGHERITGELKKKEQEEDLKSDPFASPEDKKNDNKPEGQSPMPAASSVSTGGAKEQAATISRETPPDEQKDIKMVDESG